MKKLFILILALVLVLCFAVSCNKDNSADNSNPSASENASGDTSGEKSTSDKTDKENNKNQQTEKIPDGAVLLSTDAGCRIVYTSECFDAALSLYDGIFALDERAYEQIGYYDVAKDSKPMDDKIEIVIGDTSREASALAKSKIETYLDYSISIENGSIAIFSYSHARIIEAVDHFISCLVYTDGGQLLYVPSGESDLGKHGEYPAANIKIGDKSISDFTLIYPTNANETELTNIGYMLDWIGSNTGAIVKSATDESAETPYEIVIGKTNRAISESVYSELAPGEYLYKAFGSAEGIKIVIAYAHNGAMDALFADMVEQISSTGAVPEKIEGKVEEEQMIVTNVNLRDPCVVLENGVYYVYGTGWEAYKNTSGKLDGEWVSLGRVVTVPADATDNYWAPEVHKYNGEFYMFTTYKSATTGHRGCAIFKSSTPEGPFVEISNGHVTPSDWDSIDGTLYVDEEGQPWMIFVHEWTSTDDGIGRMAAAKLSDDLTHFISEPIELFRAKDPSWSRSQVTDGCWLYRCQNGELLMIWSTGAADGYCVGIARSDNGKIDGNWSHDDTLLYSKTIAGDYDGGHGMIFTSLNGQMYLSIHSPNNSSAGRSETFVLIEIKEENGTLVWAK